MEPVNCMTTAFVVGIVVALIKVLRHQGRRTAEFVSGTLLNSFVIWAIGVAQIHDNAANNTGLLLASDIVINSVGLILVIWHAASRRRDNTVTTDATVTAQPAHV